MNIGGAVLIGGVLLWIFALQPLLEKTNLTDFPAKGSVTNLTYNKSDKKLSMYSASASLDTLIDTGLFEPLKPGDDPNIAKEKIGDATRFRTEGDTKSEHQDAFREYEMSGYTLLLSTYLTRYASTANTDYEEDIFHALESRPHGVSYYQVLRGDALSNIPNDLEEKLKIISVDVGSDNYGPIELSLVGSRVEKMRWYENRPKR